MRLWFWKRGPEAQLMVLLGGAGLRLGEIVAGDAAGRIGKWLIDRELVERATGIEPV
jgi:hypothetical protein